VKLRPPKRRWMLVAALILALLFLVRPGANRLKSRVVNSMSLALNRQTDVSSISFHILPRPGFDLENLVVHDDPSISAEPMLRSGEVSAALRLSSLLRGRIEIARLNLIEPSFNLVRTNDGRWNLEDLVERAAKAPVAPTSKAPTEMRPGFPYIEATRARVNIKLGQEKKAFALTDADLSVWQESEDTWGLRLRAQPVRTDLTLTDMGLLRVNGTWRRAENLRDTPLDFSVSWQGSQLGQLTKLVFARDRGWRGGVDLSATLKGRPTDLTIAAQGSIQDFRRYDIVGGENVRLATLCNAHFDSRARQVQNLDCKSNVGEGNLQLTGEITDPLGTRTYNLTLAAERVSMQALVNLARRAKKDLPASLIATGQVEGTISAKKAPDSLVVYEGSGETSPVTIRDRNSTAEPFELGKIEFDAGVWKDLSKERRKVSLAVGSSELKLTLRPFAVSMGRSTPATAGGSLFRNGYNFQIAGEGEIQRFLKLARLLGLPGAQPPAEGIAKVEMKLAGAWTGFAAPRVEGTAQLHNVRAEVRGTSSPIEIASAQFTLTQDEATFDKLAATAAGGRWTGTIVVPRQCQGDAPCFTHFNLQVDTLSSDEVNQYLVPMPGNRPWYRVLSGNVSEGPSPFASLRAGGTLRIGKVVLGKLVATKVETRVELDDGLRLSDLRAQLLGGLYRGDWTLDFSARPPTYSGQGQFERIDLAQLGQVSGGDWATGIASGHAQIKATGITMAALQDSSEGALEFDMRSGKFTRASLREGSDGLAVQKFTGKLVRRGGKFELREGKLQSSDSIYQVSGTISAGGKLDVKLARSGGGYEVTGTLAAPLVVPDKTVPTQAELK
jgi:hypothetical protein